MSALKTIVLPVADKGGCGKTTCLLLIANYLKTKGQRASTIDCDSGNRNTPTSFAHFFDGKTATLDLRRPKDCDKLLELGVSNPGDFLLVDLPANSQRDLKSWFRDVVDKSLLQEIGLRMVGVAPVVSEPGAAKAIGAWMSMMNDAAEYIVMLNRIKFDPSPPPLDVEFRDWGHIDTTGLKITRIEVDNMADMTMEKWLESAALPLNLSNQIPSWDRKRIASWTERVNKQLDASDPFGICNTPSPATSA